jgi:hypothetical protein
MKTTTCEKAAGSEIPALKKRITDLAFFSYRSPFQGKAGTGGEVTTKCIVKKRWH